MTPESVRAAVNLLGQREHLLDMGLAIEGQSVSRGSQIWLQGGPPSLSLLAGYAEQIGVAEALLPAFKVALLAELGIRVADVEAQLRNLEVDV